LDDRDERAGVKFKDADLIGIPLRVTIGAKGLEKGIVELRRRRDGKTDEIPLADAVKQIKSIINQSLQA
jgi:prolyl-tRNA synthetase